MTAAQFRRGMKSGGRAMALNGRKARFCVAAMAASLALIAFAAPEPASAGFFDRLFGDIRRAVEPSRAPSTGFTDPFSSLANHFNPSQERLRSDASGPAKAFCVRTCDGHFFPVQAHAGVSAAESCRSFCPASETKLYGGTNIETASASDGTRYGDLPNAFAYRKHLVAGCTCNGRNSFGLARLDAVNDPTLRQGDIVATKSGLVAFTGNRNSTAEFTPVENYSRLSKSAREKLAETKVAPQTTGAAPSDITSSITPAAANARAEAPLRR
jgi:hypothetical protein